MLFILEWYLGPLVQCTSLTYSLSIKVHTIQGTKKNTLNLPVVQNTEDIAPSGGRNKFRRKYNAQDLP